jgi:hypothetical protein
MASSSSVIAALALTLALVLAGCTAGGAGTGTPGNDQIVVQLDPSVPDVATATTIAERDCAARRGEAYLLTPPAANASAGPRQAVFACRANPRLGGGSGNQAGGAR